MPKFSVRPPIKSWLRDYYFAFRAWWGDLTNPRFPMEFTHPPEIQGLPVILLPGLYGGWHFLKYLARDLSRDGHPVYLPPGLNFMMDPATNLADRVEKFLSDWGLNQVILLGHSKGGLVGKLLLDRPELSHKIALLITIATPFHGSTPAAFIMRPEFQELKPESPLIQKINAVQSENNKIVSVYGRIDNLVWPIESCELPGALNVQIDCFGHHEILSNHGARSAVRTAIRNLPH